MAFTTAKRKRAEDTHHDAIVKKPHKRHHSNYAPSSVISSEAELTSRLKRPIVAGTPNLSADEAPSLSFQNARVKSTNTSKGLPANKATEQKRSSDSSSDEPSAVKFSKVAARKNTTQKDDISTSKEVSLDEGNVSIADPTNTSTNAPSSPPSEEVRNRSEDGLENEEDDEEQNEDEEDDKNSTPSSPRSTQSSSDTGLDSGGEPHPNTQKKESVKADNPSAFASSMAGILSYKLTRTQRANPILARSADAKEADETLLDMKLEKKAKAEMKKEKFKKGGMEVDGNGLLQDIRREGAGDIDDSMEGQNIVANQQREKELRKIAQRGVVKMFNAFASVREKAMDARGLVGSRAKREEKLTEMSKEGWLEYVGGGGKGMVEEKGKAVG